MESEAKILESSIKSVIVYQKGAQITETGTINLIKGEQIITITELPDSLDKESMRVKGVGKGKIINILVEFNSKKEYRKEEHEKLQKERERTQKEIKKEEQKVSRITEQIAKLKSTEDKFYSIWPKAYAYGEAKLANFIEFNEKISENIKKKTNLIDSLEENIRELRRKLQVTRNKMSKLGPVEEIHNFYEIKLNLNVIEDGEFIIEIRYTMTQAWWIPHYDISLRNNNARLTMYANVYNRTGLDFENVDVEISTASLKPISLVRPNPMILQEYVPHVYKAKKEMRAYSGKGFLKSAPSPKLEEKKLDLLMDFDEEEEAFIPEEEPMPEIEETYAEVAENIGVQSFKIPDKLTIPSDKNPHPVNLTVIELETEKKYFWSSAASDNVIIRDKFINGDLLLLAGNVKIYYLDEFLGETTNTIIAPKEEFKLGTRVSYDLKVDKKLIDRSKDKKVIKGKIKNNYEYKISIKNLNNVAEDLTIFDRIPHSSSENIKVEIETIIPKPDKKELGVLKWKFNLKGIEEKSIQYKYFVEYKKGMSITPSLP